MGFPASGPPGVGAAVCPAAAAGAPGGIVIGAVVGSPGGGTGGAAGCGAPTSGAADAKAGETTGGGLASGVCRPGGASSMRTTGTGAGRCAAARGSCGTSFLARWAAGSSGGGAAADRDLGRTGGSDSGVLTSRYDLGDGPQSPGGGFQYGSGVGPALPSSGFRVGVALRVGVRKGPSGTGGCPAGSTEGPVAGSGWSSCAAGLGLSAVRRALEPLFSCHDFSEPEPSWTGSMGADVGTGRCRGVRPNGPSAGGEPSGAAAGGSRLRAL